MNSTEIAIRLIRTDGGTQPRAELNDDTVQDYAQQMLEGAVFPDVVLFYDGTDHWLADGFHRHHAAQRACRETINAEVRQGTRRDAVLYSVGANASHGLRRTNADKRRAVETLLRDEEWGKWSDREIASRCGVSHPTVSSIRQSLSGKLYQIEPRYVERNGTVYTMNTTSIGQQQAQELPQQNLTKEEFLDEVFPVFHLEPRTVRPLNSLDDIFPGITEYQKQGAPVPESWKLPQEVREVRRVEAQERIAQLKAKGVELPAGKYSCLVVDPPWLMQKIERDVRPNQVEFDYPTMTEDELKAFPLPQLAGDDCHLYLWTTQKHLPLALRLAEHWGFRYQCVLTWVKNIGFTPFSCEASQIQLS